MNKFSIICVVIFVGTISIMNADWSTDLRLTNNDSLSQTSINNAWCVDVSSSGQVYVGWYDMRDGNKEIYFKYTLDDSWSSDTRLTNNSAISQAPCIALGCSKKHAVWCDTRDGNEEIYYNELGPGLSRDKRLTSNDSLSKTPSLAVKDSTLHVVWCDWRTPVTDIYYKRSTNNGRNWSNDAQITSHQSSAGSVIPSIALADTCIHVVWTDTRDGHYEIYYNRSLTNGNTWGTDTRISSNDASVSVFASIAVSGSNVHVVWEDVRDGNYEIYYVRSTNNGTNWGNNVRLTSNDSSSNQPNIAVCDSHVYVVWTDEREGNKEIYFLNSANNGTNWSNLTRLTNNNAFSGYASIAVLGTNLYVVWTDERDGNREIYYKSYTPGKSNITKKDVTQKNNDFCRVYQTSSYLRLMGSTSIISPLQFKIYDITGREMSTFIYHPVTNYYDFIWKPDLPSGVFFITVNQKGIIYTSTRFIQIK